MLEHISSKVDAISEGHGILLNEIKEGNRMSEDRDRELNTKIEVVNQKLDDKLDKVITRQNDQDLKMEKIVQKVFIEEPGF